MPYTVEASFTAFYNAINLDGDHREIANTRRNDIVTTLSKTFTILESFSTGSIPKFTALREHADLDVMVALDYDKHIKDKSPTQVLQNIRDTLAEWRTGARKNGQAVTLYYKTWPNVDIVPVSRTTDGVGNVLYYKVPDSKTNTWIQSNPKTHTSKIEAKSSVCGENFRRIIKIIKHWNRIHGDYLQSFHIEALALQIYENSLDEIGWNVFTFFSNARPLLETSLWYDTGYVDKYLTWSDRQEVLKRIDIAIEKSCLAWHKTYNKNNDHKGAIEIWKQIFSSKFPDYG